jgi:hypothetical protein
MDQRRHEAQDAPRQAALGEFAPGFAFPEARGGVYSLEDALEGGFRAVLVFLRHYG